MVVSQPGVGLTGAQSTALNNIQPQLKPIIGDATLNTNVTPSSTAGVYGAYVQFVASSSVIYYDLLIELLNPVTAGNTYTVAIGTGAAGSEVDFIEFSVIQTTVAGMNMFVVHIPVKIASGTRVAVRCKNTATSAGSLGFSIVPFGAA